MDVNFGEGTLFNPGQLSNGILADLTQHQGKDLSFSRGEVHAGGEVKGDHLEQSVSMAD